MIDFIAKYWLQCLFTLFTAGATALIKYFLNQMKKSLLIQKEELLKKAKEESDKLDMELDERIECLQAGILSLMSQEFYEKCRVLLEEKHEISLEEFEAIEKEHIIYNNLGGNHKGDTLFALVEKKYESSL